MPLFSKNIKKTKILTAHKTQLIEQISKDLGMSKKNVSSVISGFIDTVISYAKQEYSIVIPGLFSLQVKYREERMGRNPSNGDRITIGARHVVKIKPGKRLIESVKSINQ